MRDFYRSSVLKQGKRLVLLVNGQAIGTRKIDRPVADGSLLIFLEMPDEDLPDVAKNIQRTLLEVQKKLKS